MILKRRTPEPWGRKIRNLIWPQMGWKRTLLYYRHRVVRIDDSSHNIAAGLAIGCAVSFVPAFGTHLIQCVLICRIIGGNWIASWIGTIFGNPWTFPFLLWLSYQIGKSIFHIFGYGDYFGDIPKPLELSYLLDAPFKIFFPMLVGGYVCMLISFPLFYYPFRTMLRGARRARRARMKRKAHRVAIEVTGQEN